MQAGPGTRGSGGNFSPRSASGVDQMLRRARLPATPAASPVARSCEESRPRSRAKTPSSWGSQTWPARGRQRWFWGQTCHPAAAGSSRLLPAPWGQSPFPGRGFFPLAPFPQTTSPKRTEPAERSPVDGGDLADRTGLAFLLVSSC